MQRTLSRRRRGQVIVLAVLVIPALLMLAGLALDGVLLYYQRLRLAQFANLAALQGANQIDRVGNYVELDSYMAPQVTCQYLSTYHAQVVGPLLGPPTCPGTVVLLRGTSGHVDTVQVTVQQTYSPLILGYFGVGNLTLTGESAQQARVIY